MMGVLGPHWGRDQYWRIQILVLLSFAFVFNMGAREYKDLLGNSR